MNVIKTKNKTYKLVAPDGGWGYVICFAVILNMITISSFINSFGIIFKDLFIQLKMDSRTIALFNGVNCFGIALTGFITNPLLKYMSIRQLGFGAVLVYNLGTFCSVFVNSQFLFFCFQGVFMSVGNGMIFNLTFTALNSYFVKKRLLAASLAQTVIAVSSFAAPQFVKWAMETYGFRGTLLLISGISMHSFLAMTLMQPVSWHMKRVEVPEDKDNETKLLLEKENKCITIKEELDTSIKSYNKVENAVISSDKNLKDVENKETEHSSRLKHVKFFLCQIVDVSLFKPFVLSNACLGTGLSFFTEFTYTLMVPQALYYMAWTEDEVAWAVSLNALGDLITRIFLLGMSGVLSKFGSNEIYVVGLVIAFGSRLGMLWSDNKIAITIFMTIMGIPRCGIMVLTPVVIADSVDQSQFTSAMGWFFLIFGVFNLTIGPIIGAVRDLTHSYATAFYILTSFYAIVIMFWSIELFYKKTKHKRQPKTDMSSKP